MQRSKLSEHFASKTLSRTSGPTKQCDVMLVGAAKSPATRPYKPVMSHKAAVIDARPQGLCNEAPAQDTFLFTHRHMPQPQLGSGRRE